MLRAELERREPGLMPVLRRRAASWCLDNDLPEEALEYSIAAGDVGTAGRLVQRLWLPTYRQARVATIQRWLGWLDDRGGTEGHPMLAVLAGFLAATTGHPAEAEQWADVVDRWQNGDTAPRGAPVAEAWAALLGAILCRRGVEQMRVDADQAVQRLAAEGVVAPVATFCQGIARVLSGDLHGADVYFKDAVSAGGETAPDVLAAALSEQALLAMARTQWSQAETLAGQAATALREGRIEDSWVTPLICAAQARAAWHQADVSSARQELIRAQRSRPLLTYAIPHIAVQARIELARVHLALGDLAGARTLMREIDELLRRRPDLGTLAGEVDALRAQLAMEHGPSPLGSSSLTGAELRLLPLLSTHLSFREIGQQLFLSRNTIKSEATSTYRKLGVFTRSQAVLRARELGLLDE
ncbi:MAG: LuxR C-terminal-related transcriptional regulator [Actinomycetota bacterium]